MSRLPVKPREELKDDRLALYDSLTKTAQSGFGPNGDVFTYKTDQGGFLGPFAFALAEPQSGAAFFDLLTPLAKIQMPKAAKEVAILTTGAHFKSAYEVYAHSAVGQKAGLSKAQVDAIVSGSKPTDLDAACSAAYDVAHYLSSKPGPLPQELWDISNKELGRESTIGLLHYIGYYAYVSIILNATDAKVPA